MKKNTLFLLSIGLLMWSACGDDPAPPTPTLPSAYITDVSQNEGDANTTLNFTVTLVGENTTNVILSYATIDGTAIGNNDFRKIDDGELIIPAGQTFGTISITILGDDVPESDETFDVLLFNPTNVTLTDDRAKGTITNDDNNGGSGGLNIPTTGHTTPTSYPNMTLVWQDEFDGTTLSSDWVHETGTGNSGWGNNELQYYRSQNTSFQDGNLIIEAKQENFGGRNYTSSRLKTQGLKNFKYGRVDIRAVLPKGQGIWPALWMLGESFSTAGWPACGEIDIMELVGHEANKTYGTVHWEDGGHKSYGGNKSLSTGNFIDEFHVFSIVWDSQSIKWFLDDVQYHIIDITDPALSEFHGDFFFIFNVAVGGNWPGSPNTTTQFPQYMIVDYVRVFQ